VNDKQKSTHALDLEVEEVEFFACSGCGTSSTSPRCTCPVSPSTTGSLFTAEVSR
jgi:hypothetical protein